MTDSSLRNEGAFFLPNFVNMRQIIFTEFDLIVATNISDLFQWFGVTDIHGLVIGEAIDKDIDSMVHYHPNDTSASLTYKPFIFLNSQSLSNLPIHESSMIIFEASQRLSELLCEGYTETQTREVSMFRDKL